jgi:hypothetical protein
MHNAAKIFQDEILSLLISGGIVRLNAAASEKVSEKNDAFVVSRIAQCLQKISHTRLHD